MQPFTRSEWSRILSRNEYPSNLSQSRLNESLVQGLPEDQRGAIWYYLSGAADKKAQYPPDYYQTLIRDCSESDREIIGRDVPRTLPEHPQFLAANGPGQTQLTEVLCAYAAYDENIRYCQGMNFIAAVLVLYLPQSEAAFWVFVQLLTERGWKKVFYPNTPKLKSLLNSLNQQVEKRFPDIYDHCMTQSIEPAQPFAQFFISLFCTDCPLPMSVRFLDVFMNEGEHVLFVLILRMLQGKRNAILSLQGDELYTYLRKRLAAECCQEFGLQFLLTALHQGSKSSRGF